MATRRNASQDWMAGEGRTPGMEGPAGRPEPEREGELEGRAEEMKEKVGERAEEMKEKARGMGQRVKQQASGFVEERKSRAAERMEDVSERLEERAETMDQQGTLKRQAGRATHRASDALEEGAEYLRTHPVSAIGDDISSQIRRHPFLSMGAAFGAGYMVGRVFGGEEEEEEPEPEVRWVGHRGGMFGEARQQLGRALVTGLSAMLAGRIRERASGHHHGVESYRAHGTRH